jgi:hypothetical protein
MLSLLMNKLVPIEQQSNFKRSENKRFRHLLNYL